MGKELALAIYSPVVTTVLPAATWRRFTFCHTLYCSIAYDSNDKSIPSTSPESISRLVLLMKMYNVHCEVGNEVLCITSNVSLQAECESKHQPLTRIKEPFSRLLVTKMWSKQKPQQT